MGLHAEARRPIVTSTEYQPSRQRNLRVDRETAATRGRPSRPATPTTSYYGPATTCNGNTVVIADVTSTGFLYVWAQDSNTWNQQLVA